MAGCSNGIADAARLAARSLKLAEGWCAEFVLVACRREGDAALIWIYSRLHSPHYPNQLTRCAAFYHTSGLARLFGFRRGCFATAKKVSARALRRTGRSIDNPRNRTKYPRGFSRLGLA